MPFEASFKHVVGMEGGYVDDPKDSGGATNFGITEGVARRNGYTGHMRDLPLSVAKAIYKSQYWDKIKGDTLISYDLPVTADKMFDAAVNVGVGRAVIWLQHIMNLMNATDVHYTGIREDGDLGNNTLKALRVYMSHRKADGDEVLRKSINGLQAAHYFDLAERRPKDTRFIYGWIRHRID